MHDRAAQIRGWKEIATYLQASVRTARRWERTRQLPVHRVSGGVQDAVFARGAELDAWLESRRPRAGGLGLLQTTSSDRGSSAGASDGASPAQDAGAGRVVRAAATRRFAVVAGVAALGALAVIALVVVRTRPDPGSPTEAWRRALPQAAPSTGQRGAQSARRETIFLTLSRPDGWTARIGIPDSEAGRIGGSGGRPVLLLWPRHDGADLTLEIARADGQPVTGRPAAPRPFAITLPPGVIVGVLEPFPFSVEWSTSRPPG